MKEMCSKNGVKLTSQNFETYVEEITIAEGVTEIEAWMSMGMHLYEK